MTTPDETTASVTVPTVTVAPAGVITVPAPGGSAGEQRPPVAHEVYAGLQRSYQKLQEERDAAQGAIARLQAELQTAKDTGTKSATDLEALRSQVETTSVDLTKTKTEAAQLDVALKRARMIMSKYPGLAEFESRGLIPTVPEAELEKTLSDFASILNARGAATIATQMAGASPPTALPGTSPTPEETEEYLWEEVSRYAGVPGKDKEFKAAREKLDKLLLAKSRATTK